MMKKYIVSTLLAAVLLLACQKQVVTQTTEATTEQLQVNVTLQNPTKAPVIGASFGNGAEINIRLKDKAADGKDYNVEQVYVLDRQDLAAPGSWAAKVSPGLMVKRSTAAVTARYPHDAELVDGWKLVMKDTPELDLGGMNMSGSSYLSFDIAIDPAKPSETAEVYVSKEEIDYMFGNGTDVSIADGVVETQNTTITMKHLRAMVVVKFTKEKTYMGADELMAIEFKNKKPNEYHLSSGVFNTVTGEFDKSSATRYKRTMSKFSVESNFALLANPATAEAGEVQLAITLGPTSHIFNLPKLEWESGKVYIYNVKLKPSGVTLDNQVTMIDWLDPIKKPIELN